MKHTKSPNFRPSALSLALISMVMAGSLNAGMIDNSNNVAAGGFLAAAPRRLAARLPMVPAWAQSTSAMSMSSCFT